MSKKSIGIVGRKKIEFILINLLVLSFASCINNKGSKQNAPLMINGDIVFFLVFWSFDFH